MPSEVLGHLVGRDLATPQARRKVPQRSLARLGLVDGLRVVNLVGDACQVGPVRAPGHAAEDLDGAARQQGDDRVVVDRDVGVELDGHLRAALGAVVEIVVVEIVVGSGGHQFILGQE